MATPFDEYSFDPSAPDTSAMGAAPGISADDVLRVLVGRPNTLQIQQADTKGGVERVNKNSANTGAVAYRDEKGHAVLTNVAKDPISGKDVKLGQGSVVPQEQPTSQQQAELASKPSTPLNVFNLTKSLRSSATFEEAQGIYDTLQRGITEERSRIETEAFKFAEQKLGIPQMAQQLEEARQADRKDPLYLPGMGDSPITQKIQAELNALRNMADNEAKNFLTQNISYRAILTAEKTAGEEFKRKEQENFQRQQKQASIEATRASAEIQRKANQQIRRDDFQFKEETELLQKYEGLNNAQLARLSILHAADLTNYNGITDDKERKIKTMQLVLNKAKDKQFQEVMNAENDQQLLGYALQGNRQARTVAIANEAARRGIDPKQVDAEIIQLERAFADPEMALKVLQKRKGMKPEEAKAQAGQMQAAALHLDPNKKMAATQERLTLMLEASASNVTDRFINDVRSWAMTDPAFLRAINKAVDVTGGAKIEDVAVAYVEDATGPERLSRVAELQGFLKTAAGKYQGSIFGEPNATEALRKITEVTVERGLLGSLFNKARRKEAELFGAGPDRANLHTFGAPGSFLIPATSAVLDALFPQKNGLDTKPVKPGL